MLDSASTVLAARQHGVRFVDEYARLMRISHVHERVELTEVTIHRINAFDDDELALPLLTREGRIKRFRIVMLEPFCPGPREDRAVTKAQVRTIIHDRDVALPQQGGNRPESAAETAIEKHRVLVAQKLGHLFFELAMEIGHPGKHW